MKVSVESREEGNIWGEHLGKAWLEAKQDSPSHYVL